jgi:hypothetical protein
MEPKGSLPLLQKPTTCTYPELTSGTSEQLALNHQLIKQFHMAIPECFNQQSAQGTSILNSMR